MLQDRHRAAVSIGTAACLLFASVASTLTGSPREAPVYALSSSVVFFLERFFATFVLSYAVLAIVVRSLVHGELPAAITREGLTWPDEAVSGAMQRAIAKLQAQLDELEKDLDEIAEHVVLEDRLP